MIKSINTIINNSTWGFFFNYRIYNNSWINDQITFYKSSKKQQFFFNTSNFIKSIFLIFSWFKVRILYYLNNWVYTTNHKRIAVNYFWFVILSGIFGMVLATVIRLELAYPGVGIFAGDSLQYLSLVTAHGVIMVFFMIIPLISGAFANFLLPTQLGVHDVAFPRLNSAAFWFLPGGLIMLGQLICIDRRYQRMNCFNIREIQSILKRRFFNDLINTHDHHNLLDKTMIGLRFKTNDMNTVNPNIFLFYNYGLETSPKFRSVSYNTIEGNRVSFNINPNSFFFTLVNYFSTSNVFYIINQFYLTVLSNLTYSTNFFALFKNTYTYTIANVLSVWNLLNNNTSDLGSNFLRIFYNFFESLHDFSLLPVITNKLDSFVKNLINVTISSIENYLYTYLRWLNLKQSFYNFFSLNELGIFFKNIILGVSQSNIWGFLFLNGGRLFTMNTVYEFFFIIQTFEFLFFINKSVADFNLSVYTYYIFVLTKLYDYNIYVNFLPSQNFKSPNLVFANYSDPYLLYDKNSVIKTYWFNSLFYQNTSTSKIITKKPLNDNLNYDSNAVYVHVLLNLWYNIPYFIVETLTNIFSFKNTAVVLNDFYSFLVNWYVPLILTDNVFNFYLIFGKNQAIRGLLIDVGDLILNVWEFFILFIKVSYTKAVLFFNWTVTFNVVLLPVNLIFTNTVSFLIEYLGDLLLLISVLFFNLKTFSVFDNLYDFLMTKFYNRGFLFYKNNALTYTSNYFTNSDSLLQTKYSNEESSLNSRYQRFSNPVFKYDYKSGDYFPKLYKEVYSYLFSTSIDVTGALRTAPWFISNNFMEIFSNNFNVFFDNITKTNLVNLYSVHSWNASRIRYTDAFYNFFYSLNSENQLVNKRWVSLNTANQKFYRMFFGSSMQQRIYSNWRQLKFTREAWRCKLLSARHQKTMFRRYVNEDGVFWSIERNARDLLPGWAMITPFSSRVRYTAIGKTDIGLMAVFLTLNASMISAANFLVTYRYLSTLNNRKMRDSRSFFTEGIMCSSWMMLAANPMLAIGILMLLSDRHWQTSFFDYSGGGDTVLFQHMFWFFGHPEVYIVIIPCFGFTNTILSHFLKKRVSARASLLYSMYTIAFLGFFVWGHHMYMVGLSHTTRMLFSTLTVMISVPAATKIMHWCVTIANSAFTLELPLLCTLTFIFLFVSGGISGMAVAHTGMDVLFHDTFYVIGHFHVMFAGAAMFAAFGAFYFYFAAIFGVKYSRIFAYLHYVYYLIGHLMTFVPMFWLGYAGMPRRILDYPSAFGGWHSLISAGHMLSVAGLIAFFIMIFDSLRQAKAATRNTFGIGRYNTRLNFYLYENARLLNIQRKGSYLYRFLRPSSIKLNGYNYSNYEYLETTLFSYTFTKR